MGDRPPKGTLVGLLPGHVNPLVIAGDLGEAVNHLLIDCQPVGDTQFFADHVGEWVHTRSRMGARTSSGSAWRPVSSFE